MKDKKFAIMESDALLLLKKIKYIEQMMGARACAATTAIEEHAFSFYGKELLDLESMFNRSIKEL